MAAFKCSYRQVLMLIIQSLRHKEGKCVNFYLYVKFVTQSRKGIKTLVEGDFKSIIVYIKQFTELSINIFFVPYQMKSHTSLKAKISSIFDQLCAKNFLTITSDMSLSFLFIGIISRSGGLNIFVTEYLLYLL